MNDDNSPIMIMYPPDLYDESAYVAWESLREISRPFKPRYSIQRKRRLIALESNSQDGSPCDQCRHETDDEPF